LRAPDAPRLAPRRRPREGLEQAFGWCETGGRTRLPRFAPRRGAGRPLRRARAAPIPGFRTHEGPRRRRRGA